MVSFRCSRAKIRGSSPERPSYSQPPMASSVDSSESIRIGARSSSNQRLRPNVGKLCGLLILMAVVIVCCGLAGHLKIYILAERQSKHFLPYVFDFRPSRQLVN